MKKLLISILLLCVLFSISGCSVMQDITTLFVPTETVFTIDDYNLQITADSSFQDCSDNFDLQITNDYSYISIMAYKYSDLDENFSPQDLYDWHHEDIFSQRDNVILVEQPHTEVLPQCTIVRTLYTAYDSNVKNYYASYLFDFPDEETMAWVLATAAPPYYEKNSEYLHNIVTSLSTIP